MSNINWEEIRINASISAMQGIMESGTIGLLLEADPSLIAKQAIRVADALVAELQKSN